MIYNIKTKVLEGILKIICFIHKDYIKRKIYMPKQQFNSKNNETKPLQGNRNNYTHQIQNYIYTI